MSLPEPDVEYAALTSIYGDLPEISSVYDLEDANAFEYCLERKNFVLVCPYTLDGHIVARGRFTYRTIAWTLLGGSLKAVGGETHTHAADRILNQSIHNVDLADLAPLALVSNKFAFNGQEWHHRGIAFSARIRNPEAVRFAMDDLDSKIQLLDIANSTQPQFLPTSSNQVVNLAVQHAQSRLGALPPHYDEEVAVNRSLANRFRFHNTFVKPTLRVASHYVGTQSIAEFEALIEDLIYASAPESFLDVSCGENDLTLRLTKQGRIPLVVANDVSWSQVQLLRQRAEKEEGLLLYTNHDATNLPFADAAFDVAYCKNTLHHLADPQAVISLIRELKRVARNAIIVEVMDPSKAGLWPRLRHQYYLRFLRDQAVHFYTPPEFAHLMTRAGGSASVVNTVRGEYAVGVISAVRS